jgi:hypothetical protein
VFWGFSFGADRTPSVIKILHGMREENTGWRNTRFMPIQTVSEVLD